MAYVKKIRAGLVPNASVQTFVGDPGTIFYDPAVGSLFLSDGITPGGTSISSGGGGSILDFGEGFSLTAANKIVTNKLYSTNLTQPTQHYRLEVDTNGVVILPDQSIINGSYMRAIHGSYAGLAAGPDQAHNEESWMWVDGSGAYIATKYSTDQHQWVFNNDGTITFPTKTTLDFTRRDLVGPTLQMGNDPTVSDAVITGPAPNLVNPNAVRLIIQGQEGFGLPQAGGAEGGDVYIWAGHGGEGNDFSGNGGDVKLRGGIGGLDGGYIRLESGDANATNGTGGFLDLNAGNASNSSGTGGSVNIRAGSGLLTSGTVNINTNNKQWVFSPDGSLTLPGAFTYPNGALQQDTGAINCQGNASTVVFTATGVSVHTIRLLIQVEGTVGAAADMDTQACEMIIAKSFRANALAASVYGVVHTSVAPLATFTTNWNALTSRIEVLCTAPSANNVNVKIFATEITTSD
ncbi:hypothetical protein UFOVP1636_298 [uncultured Caudovirales phage]|uniref:Uncharacterized protein n=1 Tax=uncultured Caudovirales phage TaxID=2100421 RepID=A0A6J5T3N5_9CAUD|nr:hypothetical protein UFOVP1636_298 [uncultured Caudovirales phage]